MWGGCGCTRAQERTQAKNTKFAAISHFICWQLIPSLYPPLPGLCATRQRFPGSPAPLVTVLLEGEPF